ncbi:ankyrin, partial [Peniophora sp. CONT]
TTLHVAAKNGMADIARVLLDHGALVYDTNKYGDAALHLATRHGHLDVVHVLLNHPAANELDTAIFRCCTHGDFGQTALHQAAMLGRTEVARVLLSHGA